MIYGTRPEEVGQYDLDWDEYMHYMYLPIAMPWTGTRVPKRLKFIEPLLDEVITDSASAETYVYVTARRGWACPGDPLNRPGWHSDGFGTDDVNYIWTDAFPTRFALGEFVNISDDHAESMRQFQEIGDRAIPSVYPNKTLLRLTPAQIHAAPEIPHPGGERGFIKISVSKSRYNLRGNAHNYLFDYDWKMHDREAVRNDPSNSNGDSVV